MRHHSIENGRWRWPEHSTQSSKVKTDNVVLLLFFLSFCCVKSFVISIKVNKLVTFYLDCQTHALSVEAFKLNFLLLYRAIEHHAQSL